MAGEAVRTPPASPRNKTTSVRSASPRTGTTRVPPASSRTETTSVRSTSPRTGTARVSQASPRMETTRRRSASPKTETTCQRSASPRTGTTRVAPASPRTEITRRRSASPKTETTSTCQRSASPRNEINRVRPASPKTEATQVAPTSTGKLIPNYLRAPTGSCHDMCKHGTRQEQAKEVKESRPWHKSVKGNGSNVVLIKEYKDVTASKKTCLVKPNASADPKLQPPSGETVVQEILATPCEHVDVPNEQTLSYSRATVSSESIVSDGNEPTSSTAEKEKQEISVPTEYVMVTEKEISSDAKDLNISKKLSATSKVQRSSRSPSPISKGLSAERSTAGRKNVDGRKAFEGRKSPDQTGSRSLATKKSLDGKRNAGMRTGVYSSSEENNGEANKNAEDKIYSATNGSEYDTGLNLKSNNKDDIFGNSKNDAESESLKKHIAAPKPKIVKMKPLPSLYPSALKPPSPIHPLSGVRSNKRGDNQLPKKISTTRIDAKKVGTSFTKCPSSRSSVNAEEGTITKKVGFIRVVSSARRENKVTTVKEKDPNEQDFQEDTSGSVKIPPEKESPASTKVKAKSSITLIPPVLSVSKSSIRSRTSYVPPHLKKPLVGSKPKNNDKDTPGFRKGKAVDGESGNHGPSKPSVRRNSLPRETNQVNRPSLRTRDVTVHGRDVVKSTSSSGRCLSKHPSIGRKKKGQVLFNKVIEETAKRLARTRKSNVLALVGAFETVISIQKKSSAEARPKAKKISSFKKSPG